MRECLREALLSENSAVKASAIGYDRDAWKCYDVVGANGIVGRWRSRETGVVRIGGLE